MSEQSRQARKGMLDASQARVGADRSGHRERSLTAKGQLERVAAPAVFPTEQLTDGVAEPKAAEPKARRRNPPQPAAARTIASRQQQTDQFLARQAGKRIVGTASMSEGAGGDAARAATGASLAWAFQRVASQPPRPRPSRSGPR